jgi:hypothetical protein
MRRFEHHREPLLPGPLFAWRVARYAAVSSGLIALSLGIGIGGYHWIAGLAWLDALLNASMILTGMGPVDHLETPAAKVFASAYALFSGVAFLSGTAVLLTPAVHRLFHVLHVEPGQDQEAAADADEGD